jgi:hypothetical protein
MVGEICKGREGKSSKRDRLIACEVYRSYTGRLIDAVQMRFNAVQPDKILPPVSKNPGFTLARVAE